MGKFKSFIIKYKWWLAGGAVALFALYMIRGSGGSSDSTGVIQTSYTTSDGGVGNQYTDPTLMLAQLTNQTALATQAADLQSQFNLANISKDISLATLDTNKWLGQLDSNTQIELGGLGATTQQYIADANVKTSQINADVLNRQTDAQKFIASQQNKIAKRGQEYQAIQGLLNFGGSFFK